MKGDLLKDTLAYMERLADGAGGDAELAGERAKALARLADMQLAGQDATLDEPEEAARHGEQALALFPTGEPAHREDPNYYVWWSRALRVRQLSQRRAGDPRAALQTLQRMAGVLQTAMRRFPGDSALRFDYGSALIGTGQAYDTWMEASLHDPAKALEAFAAADAVYAELSAQQPDDGDAAYQRGSVAGAQMIVMQKQGRLHEAAAHGRRAVAFREAALALQPGNTAYRDGCAGERSNLTSVLLQAGQVAEALAVSARGEALIHALEAEDPSVATWAGRRRHFAFQRGRALRAAGDAEAAVPRLRDALDGMAAGRGGTLLRRRGWCALELALALQASGADPVQAQMAATQAAADLQGCIDQGGGDDQVHGWLQQARDWPPGPPAPADATL
jgi:tetratricopeptide (TPR) repeat protein